jgi:hypothetical protein
VAGSYVPLCTPHVPAMYPYVPLRTPYVPHMYPLCTPYVPHMYPICTPDEPLFDPLFTPNVTPIHPLCTPYVPGPCAPSPTQINADCLIKVSQRARLRFPHVTCGQTREDDAQRRDCAVTLWNECTASVPESLLRTNALLYPRCVLFRLCTILILSARPVAGVPRVSSSCRRRPHRRRRPRRMTAITTTTTVGRCWLTQ